MEWKNFHHHPVEILVTSRYIKLKNNDNSLHSIELF